MPREGADAALTGSVWTDSDFRSLTDAAPIGIVVDDRHGHTIYRNPAAGALLDGQGADDDWRSGALAEYRPVLDAMVEAARERGAVSNTIAAFGYPGEPARWLRVKVAPRAGSGSSPRTGGVIAILEDVTAEMDARAETERLTHMLDATSDYVAVFRPSGEILYLNQTTRAALERLREQGGTGELVELIDESGREVFVRDALDVLAEADTWRGELLLDVGGDRKVPVSALAVAHHDRQGRLEWISLLARDITDLKEAEARLRDLATRDTLTGLANRSLASDRLAQAVARHKRSGQGVAVLFCDLDGFKAINDANGHAAGDLVLQEVARRLSSVTRATDTVARVGGDEFVIVCEGLVDRDALAELADRVISAVCEPVPLGGGVSVVVGISVGVAVVTDTGEEADADRLLTRADTAMYRAKAHGGRSYRIDLGMG
ncbi:sensor domain-containing diguanylate cyclase [Rhabdothermincola sp.]|uniref:sensor domain-containing diguanylate cyclase n=1 Tax=Rhabdothermincola sp. TaxID=2820405 RepID=UPI002FE3C288